MKICWYQIERARRIAGPDGLVLEASPGLCVGALHIETHPDRGGTDIHEAGLSRVTFGLRAIDGQPMTYDAIVRPTAYLPLSSTRVTIDPPETKRETTIRTVLDTRDVWPFTDIDGNDDSLFLRLADTKIELLMDETVIRVRLTIHQMESPDGSHSVHRELGYELPIEHLLWRRAARHNDDGIGPEAEPFVGVWLKERSIKQIPPSPIRVLSHPAAATK